MLKWLGSILAFFLSILGCQRKPPFDVTQAPQTEGEKQAASSRHPEGWMYVKTLAEDGRVLEEGWEYKKPADVHQKNGLAQLPRYVDMLLNSKRWLASVSAFQIDGDEGVSVDKKDGRVRLVDFFQSPPNAERERLARTICKRKGFSIEEDYLTEQQTRVVSWNLPSNRAVILDTLHQFAKEIHGISEEEGLKIDFHEDDDESHKFQDAGSISFVFTYPFPDPTAPAPKN